MGPSLKFLLAGALLITACGSADAQTGPNLDPAADSPGETAHQECAITVPETGFTPPKGYPATPPDSAQAAWYGSERLWTSLARSGETWDALPPDLSQKTFWWSSSFSTAKEPEPNIVVTGRKVDDPSETFRFDEGTNGATADLGEFMLVGIEFPSPGCWEITAAYGKATLSYVVMVEG